MSQLKRYLYIALDLQSEPLRRDKEDAQRTALADYLRKLADSIADGRFPLDGDGSQLMASKKRYGVTDWHDRMPGQLEEAAARAKRGDITHDSAELRYIAGRLNEIVSAAIECRNKLQNTREITYPEPPATVNERPCDPAAPPPVAGDDPA